MIGDSKVVVECLCGHGDDGRHTVVTFHGMRIVGCPYCPSREMYLVDPCYFRAPS